MTLRINEKCSESFHKEIINISSQYYRFIKKPEAKFSDVFKNVKRLFILYLVILIIFVLEIILSRAAVLRYVLMCFLIAFVVFMCISFYLTLLSNNRKLKERLNYEPEEYDLTLDDEGIEISGRSETIRQSWDILAFARVFNETICFFPKKNTYVILFVPRSKYDEIKPYIKCCIYGDNDVKPAGLHEL